MYNISVFFQGIFLLLLYFILNLNHLKCIIFIRSWIRCRIAFGFRPSSFVFRHCASCVVYNWTFFYLLVFMKTFFECRLMHIYGKRAISWPLPNREPKCIANVDSFDDFKNLFSPFAIWKKLNSLLVDKPGSPLPKL